MQFNYLVILGKKKTFCQSPKKTIKTSHKWLAERTHGEGFHELLEFLRRQEVTDVMLASRHLRQLLRPVWRGQPCTTWTSENNNNNKLSRNDNNDNDNTPSQGRPPTIKRPLRRTVRILLECILVKHCNRAGFFIQGSTRAVVVFVVVVEPVNRFTRGLNTLPDSDFKLDGYIVLCRTCWHCTDSELHRMEICISLCLWAVNPSTQFCTSHFSNWLYNTPLVAAISAILFLCSQVPPSVSSSESYSYLGLTSTPTSSSAACASIAFFLAVRKS